MVNRTKQKHRKREKHKRVKHKKVKHKRVKHKRKKHKTNNQKRRNQVGGKNTRDGDYNPDINYILLLLLGKSEIPFNIYIPNESLKINNNLNITGNFYIIKPRRFPENKDLPIEVDHLTTGELLEEKSDASKYKQYVIDYLLNKRGGYYGKHDRPPWSSALSGAWSLGYGVFDLFKFIDAGLILYNYGYHCFKITDKITDELTYKDSYINWLKNKQKITDGHCIYPEEPYGSQDMRYKLHISVKKEFIGDAATKFQQYFESNKEYIYDYKIIIPDFRHSEYKTVYNANRGYNSLPDGHKKDLLPGAANIVIYPSTRLDIDIVVTDFKNWWLQNFENTNTDAPRDENYMMFNFRIPGTRTLFFAYGSDTYDRLFGENTNFNEPEVIKNLKSWYCSEGVPKDSSNVPECLKDSLNIDESNYNEFCSNEAFPPAKQTLGARFGMDAKKGRQRETFAAQELKELNQICNTWGHWFKRGLKKCVSRGTCTTQKPWELGNLDESMEVVDWRGGGKMKHKKSKRKSRSKRKKKTRKPKQTKRKKKNK